MDARLEVVGEKANLYGAIDYATVPGLWPQLQGVIQQGGKLQVSLQHVESSNSAALVLLLEAQQAARQKATHLTFTHIPAGLQSLASMSNVQDLLDVEMA